MATPTLFGAVSSAGAIDLGRKLSCRCATAAALPAVTAAGSGVGKTLTADAVGVLTVDGIATFLNDRILVKNQVTGANNGIYLCTTEGTAGVAFVLTRATDFDTAAEMLFGASAWIEAGTVNGLQQFALSNAAAITVDTTALTFTAGLGGLVDLTTEVTGVLPVANGGTNVSAASITAFNNITGFTASGATGETSSALMFGTAPTITTSLTMADAANIIINNTTGTKIGTGTDQKIGFWNSAPVAQNTGWAMSNVAGTIVLNTDVTTLDELADVVGTLIDQLKTYGILGA